MNKPRPKIPKENKVRAELQLEINSKCPFCPSTDVGHFQVHHIDENPSNNDIKNLLMLCPTCHSKITKGDISKQIVLEIKKALNNKDVQGNLISMFTSKEIFQKEFTKLINQTESTYYVELKEHWNSFSLMSDCPVLDQIMHESLPKSIEYGLLPLMSDLVKKHLYYDKDAKYLYNQPHIYMHNSEDDGYNLPMYYHIRFIGILYATAIRNKVDIDSVARRYKNMQSIYSGMIEGMVDNLSVDGIDKLKEYPTNYHWLIGEIFGTASNWIYQFNEEENFVPTCSYVDFITFNIRLCLSELYKGVEKNKIERKFIVSQCYYGVLTHYFSPTLNDIMRNSIEQNIVSNIPQNLLEEILEFSLDEAFADHFYSFQQRRFSGSKKEIEIQDRLWLFLTKNERL
jgi:hypothetical protein